MVNVKPTYEELERRVNELEKIMSGSCATFASEISSLDTEEYRDVVELSPDAISVTDSNGKIISWNNALVALTGIRQSEAVGHYLWDILCQCSPEGIDSIELCDIIKRKIVRIIAESKDYAKDIDEQKIVGIDGIVKTVEVSSFIINSEKGKLLVSSLRDINEVPYTQIEVPQYNDLLLKLNQFSTELSKFSSSDDLSALITKRLIEFMNAEVVLFSVYEPESKTLCSKHIEIRSGILGNALGLISRQMQKTSVVINDFTYHEIIKNNYCISHSLTEGSFGAISAKMGVTIQTLLKTERYICLAYLVEGELYGTSLVGMSRHHVTPPMEMVENFVLQAAISLRRKRAEEEIQISQERLKTITDNISDIIVELDSKGIIINSRRLLSGIKTEDVIGKSFCDWAAPEYHEGMIQSLETVFGNAVQQSYQSRALGVNNEIRWYQSNLSPIKVGGRVKKAVLIMNDITERKQTEESLRESEENNRLIMQSTIDVIFIIDKSGKQIFYNNSVERVLGYRPEDLVGRSFAELLPKELLHDFRTQLNSIFINKEVFRFTTQINHKDGYLVDAEINGQLINLKGEFVVQGTITDITEKKRSDEALNHSLNRYEAMLGANPDMMFRFNSNCKIVDFHSESHDQLLVKPENFLNKLLDDILPHEVLVITKQKVDAVLSTGKADYSNYELKINGKPRYFESRYVPCGNNEVLSIVRDITERRQAEAALQLTKESYLDIFNSISEAIFVMDETGSFIDVNKGAEKMYLLTKQELIGQTPFTIGAKGRNNFDEIQRKITSVAETGTPAFFDFWAERKTGEIFPKEVIVNRGKYFGKDVLIATARDITEKWHTEERIKFKNEELINLNAEKDKFFSIIAHDLRSPFNSFLGLTQIMAEDLSNLTMSEIQKIAVSMSKSATNLYGLLENLLAWSRLQRGMTSFEPKSLLLLPKISEGMQLVLEMANRKGIETELNFQDDLAVYADQNMLDSTIRNVTSNAVKYTTKGGKITISAKSIGGTGVEISVKDTGIGMNKDLLDKLFRLDQKTSRVGTEGEPSSGLGLLLCKEFVEKHGGKIWAESEVEKGSTFYFTFPGVEIKKQENFALYSKN